MMKAYRSQKQRKQKPRQQKPWFKHQFCTNLFVHDSCTSTTCIRRHNLPIFVGLARTDEESIQRCQEFLQSTMKIILEKDLQLQYSDSNGIHYYTALTPSIGILIDLFINNDTNIITSRDFELSQSWPVSLLNVALDPKDKNLLMKSLTFFNNFMNGGT